MPSSDSESLRDLYLQAQLAGDRRGALQLLIDGALNKGTPVTEVREVIRAAQAEIGNLWAANEITVAQEHMATAISQLALSHLYDKTEAPPPNGHRVIVACVEGEQHEFPARLAADALDLAGYSVLYLGGDVPMDSLLDAVERERPHLVAVSCTLGFHMDATCETVRELRALAERLEEPVMIAVGGSGVTEHRDQLLACGADLVGADAGELLRAAPLHLDSKSS